MKKPKPKFRVGQLVMKRGDYLPIKIRQRECNVMELGDVIYFDSSNACWSETELRPLTARESDHFRKVKRS